MRRLALAFFAIAGLACGQVAHQVASSPAALQVSPAASSTPAAAPTAVPTPAVTDLRPPTPAPTPAQIVTVVANRIQGPGLDIRIVGSVGNCSATPRLVPYGGAYYDSCQSGVWLDCHVSVCPSMNNWGVGTSVTWWDDGGIPHSVTINNVTVAQPGQRIPVPPGSYHFQVCTNAAGTAVRILSA